MSHNARGWAIYCNGGTSYHNSSSQNYGSSIKTGDIIGILLDLKANTLTFYHNKKNLGIAFKNVTAPVCPAVTLYAQGDKVSIIKNARMPSK